MKRIICLFLLLALSLGLLAACRGADGPQTDLIGKPEPQQVVEKKPDAAFRDCYKTLALQLFQKSAAASRDENLMISPLSIQLALAMTANGADGQTRQEMEALLGQGIPLEELNAYLHTYVGELPTGKDYKLQIANSVWFRDEAERLTVEESFLQTNADYYDAQIYKRAFDTTTVKEINDWVDTNTDGMITKILDQIDKSAMMYLINAIAFDAQWAEPYMEHAIREGSFTDIAGQHQTVSMMHSEETTYLDDGKATGFLKPYSGNRYSFAVLLPNQDVQLYDYIESLTADGITKTIRDAKECTVITQMPKFSYEYELGMVDILREMGMPAAFDSGSADFTKMGHSADGNLFIGQVLHKTFIQVDGMGTKAGAITAVIVYGESAIEPDPNVKEVIVDRPFVYMILDNETNLPIFLGCVTQITE